MRIKTNSELILLNLIVAVLIIAIILFPSNVLRIILGLPFLLFFPGYTLILALFPKKDSIGGVERLALSFGLSIAVVPLIGLILNYTWWGITIESTLYAVSSFIFIMSIVAWVRQQRLGESEKFTINLKLKIPGWGGSTWDKALTAVLVIAILGTMGTLGYVIAQPKVGETFTEFYILGPEGKASGYPEELKVGEEGRVIVGIVNREYEPVDYRMEITIDGLSVQEVGPISLAHEEKWENEVALVPQVAGENTRVEFKLYKNGETEPILEPLYLWVNVT